MRLPAGATALERYRTSLRTAGGCMTAQRALVLSEVTAMGPHFDVQQLARRMAGHSPPVSRATVYRTIAHLEQLGLVRRVVFGEPHAHYESTLDAGDHEHLVCRVCGRVIEVSDRQVERRLEALAAGRRFTVERRTVQVVGLCRECSGHGKHRPS